MKTILPFIALFVVQTACSQRISESPPSIKDTTLLVFGQKIYDPFYGLEDLKDSSVNHWIDEQSKEAIAAIQGRKGYQKLVEEIKDYVNSASIRVSVPCVNNKVIYALEYLTDSDQGRLITLSGEKYQKSVLFTSEDIPGDGPFVISSFNPSPDNRYIAIEYSADGGDYVEIAVWDAESRRFCEEIINASISYYPYWLPDSKGLFYTQLNTLSDTTDLFDNVRVKYHKIGTSQQDDKVILERESSKILNYQAGDFPTIRVLPDSVTVRCSLARGISQYTEYYVAPLEKIINPTTQADPWIQVAPAENQVVEGEFGATDSYLLTYQGDSISTIAKVEVRRPEKIAIVLSESRGFINQMVIREDAVYAEKIVDGKSHLLRIVQNKAVEIKLPYLGDIDIVSDVSPTRTSGEGLFFGITSWNKGYAIYYYDSNKDQVRLTNIRPGGAFDQDNDLVVEQVNVLSHDSVEVPLSIIYNKKTAKMGASPVILDAYGAYGYSLEQYLDLRMMPWYQAGGIIAKAHVRGGAENGPNWHTQGKRFNKANSWKDLIACAEYLIDQKYTSAHQLGVSGASAGGVTVGMAIAERPDLFGAAVLEYPLLNPTRLAESVDGAIHYDEFGDPGDSLEFLNLYKMDPYLNLKEEEKYPALLLISGKNDTRVSLWEPAKFYAKIKETQRNGRPTLLKVYDSEHGVANLTTAAQQTADKLTFFDWQLSAGNLK